MITLKTLILNSDFNPISIRTWQQAFVLCMKDVAYGVDYYGEKARDGRGRFYPIPSVVCLKRYVPHNYNIKKKFSRHAVFQRDGYTCMYCGTKEKPSNLTIDHITAKSKSNGNNNTSFFNCVACCKPCNAKKADKTCDEFGKFPLKKPVQPTHLDLILSDVKNIPKEWLPYINVGHNG